MGGWGGSSQSGTQGSFWCAHQAQNCTKIQKLAEKLAGLPLEPSWCPCHVYSRMPHVTMSAVSTQRASETPWRAVPGREAGIPASVSGAPDRAHNAEQGCPPTPTHRVAWQQQQQAW